MTPGASKEAAAAPIVQGSFRDPLGYVQVLEDHVVRVVQRDAADELEGFLAEPLFKDWVARGQLVSTTATNRQRSDGYREYRHPKIAFPSFPSEWSPELLHRAGSLTLRLAEDSLGVGVGLKDATPMNVLFQGASPIFIDVLSFEKRQPGDPIWLPAAQFERTFLIPLLAWKHLRLPPNEILTLHRDGVNPEDAAPWFHGRARLTREYTSLIRVPAALSKRHSEGDGDAKLASRQSVKEEVAAFVLKSTFKRLRRLLAKLSPKTTDSRWHDYMKTHSYDAENFTAKETFVKQALLAVKPARVLDVGCNTGHFSALAANAGASVVGIDSDLAALDEAVRTAAESKLDFLPLAVDITRPTPALGWLNSEQPSFLSRAMGAFDLVLFLAVIHHMLVTERVPLEQIMLLARSLTKDAAVIEYVSPEDPMFRSISVARRHLFVDFTEARFEEEARKHFDIIRSAPLNNGLRRIYLMRAK